MYRMRGLGALDCSSVVKSNPQYQGAPCNPLGGYESGAPGDCYAAQNALEQQYMSDWIACNPNSAAGVNPGQIIGVPGQGPTETLYQAASQIFGGTVPTGTFQNVSGGPGGTSPLSSSNAGPVLNTPQVPPPPAAVISSSPTMPPVPVIIQSSGASTAPPASTTYNSSAPPMDFPAPSSFSFSSIPMWGWAIAGGAALLALANSR